MSKENWTLIPENARVRYTAIGRGGRNCGEYFATFVNHRSIIPSESERRLLPEGRTSFKTVNEWATAVRKMLLERMGLASAAINIWDDPRVTFEDANGDWKKFNTIRVAAQEVVAVEAPAEVQEVQEVQEPPAEVQEALPLPETDDVMQVVHSALKKVSRRASIAVATAQVAVQEADALRAELAEANRRASVAEAAHERVKEMLREMAQMAADLVQMAEEV